MYNLGKISTKHGLITLCSLVFLSSLAVLPVSAQDSHPINQWTAACLGQNPSTAGMLTCLNEAYQRWDVELNYVYQRLRGQLTGHGNDVLKTSQRAWIAYRDAEFQTMDTIYGSLQGTMWDLTRMSAKVEFIKARTLELQMYIEALLEGR